jgi:hypothetical protein
LLNFIKDDVEMSFFITPRSGLIFFVVFFFIFNLSFANDSILNDCTQGSCGDEIISRLHGLHEIANKEKCFGDSKTRDREKFYKKNGLSESCWKILTEIESLELKLSSLQDELEASLNCEGASCTDPSPLSNQDNLSDLAEVRDELSCTEDKKKSVSDSCSDDVACVFMSSALLTNGVWVEKLISKDLIPKNCDLGNDSCLTQMATSFLKAIYTFFESSWDLLKSAGGFVADNVSSFWDWVSGAEDHSSTSQLTLAEVSEEEGLFDRLLNDFSGTMMNIFNGLVGGLKEWLKASVFCQKWSGIPHFSQCEIPSNDYDCLPCKQMLTGLCSISGTLVSEVVPAFLTGGISVAAKYGASGATKIAKSIKVSDSTLNVLKTSQLSKMANKAAGHLDESLKLSRGVKYSREVLQKVLSGIKTYFLSPLRFASKASLSALKELTKKGGVYLAETVTGKVLLFGQDAALKFAKRSGQILMYPVENPMTVWAFKQGEKSFENAISLGSGKIFGASRGSALILSKSPKIEEIVTKMESLKVKQSVDSPEYLLLEEELYNNLKPDRTKLAGEVLKQKDPQIDELISLLYPELKYGNLAQKVGEDGVRIAESELGTLIGKLPESKKKKQLLKELDLKTSEGVAKLETIKMKSSISDFTESLKAAPFAQDSYSQHTLEAFSTQGLESKILTITSKTEDEILDYWRGFQFKNKSGIPVKMKPELYVGRAHGSGERTLNVMGAFIPEGETNPIGYFVVSYPKRSKGEIQPYLEIIKFDTAHPAGKGIASELIPFIGEQVKKTGQKRLDLDADWMGRIVWAKRGFVFDPDVTFIRSGQKISQVGLARENLGRFLEHHDLSLSDLVIKATPDSPGVPVNSLEDLKEPLDFINLAHKDGKKVKVKKYVDEGKYEPESEEELGIAYALGGNLRREGQTIDIIGTDDVELSDLYLPNWMGVLKLDP